MHHILDDPIDVDASFFHHRVVPTRIAWNNRSYPIEKINLIHATHEGNKRIFYFSVSDTANSFKLRLDSELLEWRLVEMYADG
ncbi:hypothetical protein HYV73_01300 [Candidatus Uhrbacteria bacterium]|nr:hypothetical protein [Candidatus Uhrbacteria bacterium]